MFLLNLISLSVNPLFFSCSCSGTPEGVPATVQRLVRREGRAVFGRHHDRVGYHASPLVEDPIRLHAAIRALDLQYGCNLELLEGELALREEHPAHSLYE